jgi:hypothetical protein
MLKMVSKVKKVLTKIVPTLNPSSETPPLKTAQEIKIPVSPLKEKNAQDSQLTFDF